MQTLQYLNFSTLVYLNVGMITFNGHMAGFLCIINTMPYNIQNKKDVTTLQLQSSLWFYQINFSCFGWFWSPLDVVTCWYCGSADVSKGSAAVVASKKAGSVFIVPFRKSNRVPSVALMEAALWPPNTTDAFAAGLVDMLTMWRSEVLFSICVRRSAVFSSAHSWSISAGAVERLCDCSKVKLTGLWLNTGTSEGPGKDVTLCDTAEPSVRIKY